MAERAALVWRWGAEGLALLVVLSVVLIAAVVFLVRDLLHPSDEVEDPSGATDAEWGAW